MLLLTIQQKKNNTWHWIERSRSHVETYCHLLYMNVLAQHEEFIYRHHITFGFHCGFCTMKVHLSIGKKLSVTVFVPRGQGLTGTVVVETNLSNVMEDTLFDMNLIADIVKKILQNFEEWNLKNSFGKAWYNHIDVALFEEGTMNYTIQVTNYGQFTNEILYFTNKIFDDFISMDIFFTNSLVTIYSRNECSNTQDTLSLRFLQKRLSLRTSTSDKSRIDFSHQKSYLSFQLKYKLILCDLDKFSKNLINEIILLQRLNPRTKFTYRHNQKVMYNNHIPLDDDYKSCQVLATSLTNVIKHSLNIEFKESCFSSLKVENSHQVEAALMIKLLPLIHENYNFSNDN